MMDSIINNLRIEQGSGLWDLAQALGYGAVSGVKEFGGACSSQPLWSPEVPNHEPTRKQRHGEAADL
jgi:hypothetical protein